MKSRDLTAEKKKRGAPRKGKHGYLVRMKPDTHRRLILAAQAGGYKHLGDWLDKLSNSPTVTYLHVGAAELVAGCNEDFVGLCDHAASVLQCLFEVLDHQPEPNEDNVQAYWKLENQYRKMAKLAKSVGFGP